MTSAKSPNHQKALAYLALQATRQGQASYAHVHEMIKGLQRRGWLVKLYEPSYAGEADEPGIVRRLLEFVRVQAVLWREPRPEVLYIRFHFASFPSALLAWVKRIPVVQEVNGSYEDLFIAWPWTRKFRGFFVALMRSQLRWADAVVAVTPQLRDWALTQGAKKVEVIPNAANTELFHPGAKPPLNLTLPEKYVVFVGALAPWQGIDVMLSAIQHPQWPEGIQLVIVGDGIERKKVQEAAEKEKKVVYLGKLEYTAIPGIVAHSLAALSPQSNRERGLERTGVFPLKMFEALACGVPVIVSDLPGMAELVRENECGLVVPPGNPGALAEAVRYVVRNEKMRVTMGTKGWELIQRAHSWDHRAEETSHLLENLLICRKVD